MQKKVKPEPKGRCLYCGRSAVVIAKQGERMISSLYPAQQILAAPVMDMIRTILKEANIVVPELEKNLKDSVQKVILNMPSLFVCETCITQMAFGLRTLGKPQQAVLSDGSETSGEARMDAVPPQHPDNLKPGDGLTPAQEKGFRKIFKELGL